MNSQVSLLSYRKNRNPDESIRSSKKKDSQYRYSIMSPASPAEYLSPTGAFNVNEIGTQCNASPISNAPWSGAAAYAKFNYTGWKKHVADGPGTSERRKLDLRHCI
jgi:hypothetical protein